MNDKAKYYCFDKRRRELLEKNPSLKQTINEHEHEKMLENYVAKTIWELI